MERLLWHLLVGTRGGLTRGRIIELLTDRPYNANALAEALGMDYKTIRHHLRVLERDHIVLPSKQEGYGVLYFITADFTRHLAAFRTIWEKVGKSEKRKAGKSEKRIAAPQEGGNHG